MDFIFDSIDDDGCKLYFTKDKKYSVIDRLDGVFLTYKLNEEEDIYDWLEDKSSSLQECEEVVNGFEKSMKMNEEIKIIKTEDYISINRVNDSMFMMASVQISNMNFLGNGEWFFNRLYVHPKMRNKRVASLLMEELIKILDEEHIVLVNQINPYGDLDYDQLVKFYKKYGFVDMEIENGLIRYPK